MAKKTEGDEMKITAVLSAVKIGGKGKGDGLSLKTCLEGDEYATLARWYRKEESLSIVIMPRQESLPLEGSATKGTENAEKK